MHSIQGHALDLFDERGVDAVTIEGMAEVSPSTVYRYFGSKEGLIVSDDFDALSQQALDDLLGRCDPVDTARRIVADYESAAGGMDGPAPFGMSPWRRVRYFFKEPSVRLAVYASLDRASNRIAASVESQRGMSRTKARVTAHAFVFGYFAAPEQWHLDGGVRPIEDYGAEGMPVLRGVWTEL